MQKLSIFTPPPSPSLTHLCPRTYALLSQNARFPLPLFAWRHLWMVPYPCPACRGDTTYHGDIPTKLGFYPCPAFIVQSSTARPFKGYRSVIANIHKQYGVYFVPHPYRDSNLGPQPRSERNTYDLYLDEVVHSFVGNEINSMGWVITWWFGDLGGFGIQSFCI